MFVLSRLPQRPDSSLMKIGECRALAVLFALILLLMSSSVCFQLEKKLHLPRADQRNLLRKLLFSSMSAYDLKNRLGGAQKQPKKAVDEIESLRKLPPSVPNPSQNK
ncbi:hypothetical protein NMG60_11003757 [Bertholletia excelsa]